MSRHNDARDAPRRRPEDSQQPRRDDRRDERRDERRAPTSSRHRDEEPDRQQHRERVTSDNHRRQPPQTHVKREHSRSPDTKAKRNRNRYANEPTDDGTHEWGKPSAGGGVGGFGKASTSAGFGGSNTVKQAPDEDTAGPVEKELPNFGLSGKLSEDTNKVNGVLLKYSEPDEARKPKRRWRLYPFKGDEALSTLFIHRQSCFLFGRDRKICDIPVDHPSCSKQHAVLQYRLVPYTREDGTKGKRVRPYVLDLESANGTYMNNQRIEARKYVEVLEKDVLKFGYSSREYVMLHENSKDEEEDDDVVEEEEVVEVVNAVKAETAAVAKVAAVQASASRRGTERV